LCRWLETYRTFQGGPPGTEFWNFHSVHVPKKLALEHPSEITTLPQTAFYWPLWNQEHLNWIFASNKPIPANQAYANHLWESFAWKYLDGLTPGRVRAIDTNFHFWARPFLNGLADDFAAPSLVQRLQIQARRAFRKAQSLKRWRKDGALKSRAVFRA
jgi:hypothetical protein